MSTFGRCLLTALVVVALVTVAGPLLLVASQAGLSSLLLVVAFALVAFGTADTLVCVKADR